MSTVTIIVENETGLHSRPADLFVRTAKLYTSSITIHKGENFADAKNIIKVILLNVAKGQEIVITAEGEDSQSALEDLARLVRSNFTEINEAVTI